MKAINIDWIQKLKLNSSPYFARHLQITHFANKPPNLLPSCRHSPRWLATNLHTSQNDLDLDRAIWQQFACCTKSHTHTRARHSRTWTLQHVLSTSWTLIPPPTNREQERERERGRGRRKQKRDESSNRRCTCKRWWSESGHSLGLELSSLFLRSCHKRHKTF